MTSRKRYRHVDKLLVPKAAQEEEGEEKRKRNQRNSTPTPWKPLVVVALLVILLHWLPIYGPPPRIKVMPPLDLVVAGFPKCGTTTLLYALQKHILMSHREVCAMKDALRPDGIVDRRYQKELLSSWDFGEARMALYQDKPGERLAQDRRVKGLKCPSLLYSDVALDRLLHDWYPPSSSNVTAKDVTRQSTSALKWIIGVRHPLQQVQSYYNYLVTEFYDKGYWLYKSIPSLEKVMEDHWKDMTPETHRYEVHLERLLQKLVQTSGGDGNRSPTPKEPLVLLYTLSHMEASDTQLAAALGNFVGLYKPLQWGHENRNRYVGKTAHPETMNVCDDRYKAVRQRILRDARATVAWLETKILAVSGQYHTWVILGGGEEAWKAELHSWTQDICT